MVVLSTVVIVSNFCWLQERLAKEVKSREELEEENLTFKQIVSTLLILCVMLCEFMLAFGWVCICTYLCVHANMRILSTYVHMHTCKFNVNMTGLYHFIASDLFTLD